MLSDYNATAELYMHDGMVWHYPLRKYCISHVSLAKWTACLSPATYFKQIIVSVLKLEFWLKLM